MVWRAVAAVVAGVATMSVPGTRLRSSSKDTFLSLRSRRRRHSSFIAAASCSRLNACSSCGSRSCCSLHSTCVYVCKILLALYDVQISKIHMLNFF